MTVAVGITTFLNMPRSEDPVIEAPQFPVIVIYPGASPEDMEELVVNPLEEVIYGLENIKKSRRKLRMGLLYFLWNTITTRMSMKIP